MLCLSPTQQHTFLRRKARRTLCNHESTFTFETNVCDLRNYHLQKFNPISANLSSKAYIFFLTLLFVLSIPGISQQSIQLTIEEREWLKNHPVVKLGFMSDIEPILIIDDSVYSGILIDIYERLQAITGFKLEIYLDEADKVIELFEKNQLDGCLACDVQIARSFGVLTTQEIFRATPTIFKKSDLKPISNMGDLYGKKVAYKGGIPVISKTAQKYKDNIDFIEVGIFTFQRISRLKRAEAVFTQPGPKAEVEAHQFVTRHPHHVRPHLPLVPGRPGPPYSVPTSLPDLHPR